MASSNETSLRRTPVRRSPRKRIAYKSSKRLKAEARASLLGNLAKPVFSVFMYLLTTAVLTELIANFQTGSVLLSLLFSVFVFFVLGTVAKMLKIGLSCIFLRLHLRKDVKVNDLFYAFSGSSDTAVQCSAFLSLMELLCMLPLLIALSAAPAQNSTIYTVLLILLTLAGFAGMIFVRIRYALCSYLFLDYPELPAKTLVRGSAKMLRGHRMRLFKLYLSFLPQYALTAISFGIAGLWVNSYTHAAEAAFYRDLIVKIHRP